MITAALAIGIMTTGFSTEADADEQMYRVQPGDTLWIISQKHNLTIQNIMDYNNLSSSMIYVGQKLSLIAPHSYEVASYTVKSGDTLYLIAKQYGTTVTSLKDANQLTSDNILVGQVLKVPNGLQEIPVTSAEKTSTYTVKSGDTLWIIATNHGLSVAQLKTYNHLTSDMLHIGQVLRLTTDPNPPNSEGKSSFNADSLIAEGKKYIGVPYHWGGNTSTGFDCSGFLKYVFNTQGITIPRTVETIWDAGTSVSSPQKGDIVFFTTYKEGPSHAGIYLGDNKFLHASTSAGVTISDLNNVYWNPRYLGAKSFR